MQDEHKARDQLANQQTALLAMSQEDLSASHSQTRRDGYG